jgi:uncharacterized heparinase superfamily protein
MDTTRIVRALRKPPHIIAQRMLSELNAHTDRFRAPRRVSGLSEQVLAERVDTTSVRELWTKLSARAFAIPVRFLAEADYERTCPGDTARIVRAAEQALDRRVDLLGTGPVNLGTPIDWHRDFKTGTSWQPAFMRDIDYTNLASPSDVKVPWEVSRLQWLMPAGQAFLLTRDERYAAAVRDILVEWIDANPYARGVNWACTMEVALRILTWTWFFHVFCHSQSWADEAFRAKFLRALYLHGDFTERYLERSDINGNHFTADAVGLVFAGLFFGNGVAPRRWADAGWAALCAELPRQVFADGVDFEASVAYHRLVLELFFLGARYRETLGLPVPNEYRERVVAMARFALTYSRPDGTVPLVGDADDARALPFGGQPIGDHRYLAGLVGAHWSVPDLMAGFSGPRSEVLWTLGRSAAASLSEGCAEARRVPSASFPQGGFYVMRNARDHVFIDCGPVGLAGRGGHGHNDCLSFEAAIDGVHLITDCGAYVYTASADERNRFRSTWCHNTPQIDGQEINRFIRWDQLWTLHDDAAPEVRQWETGPGSDLFVGSHSGYQRLKAPIRPVRTIELNHGRHTLRIHDAFEGPGEYAVEIPLHLAPGVQVERTGSNEMCLVARGRRFRLGWHGAEWELAVETARTSPSYGRVVDSTRLVWRGRAHAAAALTVSVAPDDANRTCEPAA